MILATVRAVFLEKASTTNTHRYQRKTDTPNKKMLTLSLQNYYQIHTDSLPRIILPNKVLSLFPPRMIQVMILESPQNSQDRPPAVGTTPSNKKESSTKCRSLHQSSKPLQERPQQQHRHSKHCVTVSALADNPIYTVNTWENHASELRRATLFDNFNIIVVAVCFPHMWNWFVTAVFAVACAVCRAR